MSACNVKLSPVNQSRNFQFSRYIETTDIMGIYDAVVDITDNHELACEIAGWAELATIGEIYEDDDIIAEIVDD